MSLFRERRRHLQFGIILPSLVFFAGCVSSPRSEPAGAATPSTVPVPQAAAADESPATAKGESAGEAKEDSFARPPPANAALTAPKPGAASTPTRKSATANVPAESKRAAPAFASPAAAPAPPRQVESSDSEYRGKSATLEQGVLRPTLSDSPELRTALEDFQSAVDQLAALHSCDEGCKAFQSMQRAAARICDLVGSGDAGRRCSAARNRVTGADRDIKNRCGQCP
jgi:hypothetical protein